MGYQDYPASPVMGLLTSRRLDPELQVSQAIPVGGSLPRLWHGKAKHRAISACRSRIQRATVAAVWRISTNTRPRIHLSGGRGIRERAANLHLEHRWNSERLSKPGSLRALTAQSPDSAAQEALGHERFTSIDRVENRGLDLTGSFHSEQWEDFPTYFKFHLSPSGKIRRLDIGQAS